LKDAFPSQKLVFRVVTLAEPSKDVMVPFLEAEHRGQMAQSPARSARVQFYRDVATDFHEAVVDLATGEITKQDALPGRHSYVDSTEMQAAEQACLAAPDVKEAIRLLDLPENATVCIEPWTYGTDGMNDMVERIIMVRIHLGLGCETNEIDLVPTSATSTCAFPVMATPIITPIRSISASRCPGI
jgi:primary-amine oxidase